jgi:phage terminase large subunit-like protein
MKGKPAEHEPYPAEIQSIRAMSYGLKGFRRFCKLLGLRLHPFQAYLLGFYFAGVTELVILIPKKNGKTTLLAALALYHLLMIKHAEVVIGASAREQAALLHRQATLLIEKAGLERRALPGDRREPTRYAGVFEVREGMHVIRFESGRLRVMPHEARTGDGVIPTLALIDELHRHPTGELYQVWRNGLVEGAQMITISTAGSDLGSPLGLLLQKARKYPVEQFRKRRTYTSPNGEVVLVEYALDDGDDLENLKLVKQANPAPWITPKVLSSRHESPMESRGSWARLTCNVWTMGDEPEVGAEEWDAAYTDIGRLKDGDRVWIAPSVGDNAAIGIASVRPEGRVAVGAIVLEKRENRSLYVDVEQACLDLAKRYRVVGLIDPGRGFIRSGDILEAAGLPRELSVWSPQKKMSVTATFLSMLRDGALMHDGDPILREHVLKVTLTESGGEEYMDVNAYDRAAVAVAMATHYASANDEPAPKIHVYKGA